MFLKSCVNLSNTTVTLLVYTNPFAPHAFAASITFLVPSTLTLNTASFPFEEYRAAPSGYTPTVCTTMAGFASLKTFCRASRSSTSART
jgi:hypothetical protein